MEGGNNNCFVCGRLDTKYSCVVCLRKICNVCSKPCSSSESGYSEENYMIGKCNVCIARGEDKEVPDEVAITPTNEKKQKQSSLFSHFSKGKVVVPCKKPTKTDDQGTSSSGARALNESTAENWKSTSLAGFDASEWLVVNSDKDSNVTSLNCNVCKKYASNVENMKNFGHTWAYEGSTNLRVSNAKKHASGDPHREAMRLHSIDLGKDAEEITSKMYNAIRCW